MTILVKTRYGVMECLEGDSIVSKALTLYGEWAQLELDVLAKIVPVGGVVLDVGAFLGTHTLAFSRMVGETGTVHSFEPREPIRQSLRANTSRNGLTQVTVQPCALGAVAMSVDIPALDLREEQNFGGLAINEAPAGETARTERIEVLPLDHFTFDRIDLVKIDAEGMEAEVIAGGAHTLASHRPIIFAECNDLRNGSRTLLEFLSMNYVVYGVLSEAFNPDNYNHVSENIFFNGSEASLLAIPREKIAPVVERLDLSLFPIIDSLDALALLLLHKPQYLDEVLAVTAAAAVLGLEFSCPLSRRREAELAEVRGGTVSTVQRLEAELVDLRASLARLESERAEAERVARSNARYMRTSVAYWWERVFRGERGLSSRP